jgi:hypothetical protein
MEYADPMHDFIQTLCMDGTIDATIDQALRFLEDSFQEAKGSSAHSSYRRPGIVRRSLTSSEDDFAVVVCAPVTLEVLLTCKIPYFDRENQDYLDHRYGGVQFVLSQHFQVMKDLEDQYRTRAHSSTEDLHVSRTLDQSYYTSLPSTKHRDYDQVIYRHTSGRARLQRKHAEKIRSHRGDAFSMSDDCASFLSADGINPDDIKDKAIPQLMMVHSIWIWKIGGVSFSVETARTNTTQTRSLPHFQRGGALAQIRSWTRYCSTRRRPRCRMHSFALSANALALSTSPAMPA